MFNLFKSKKDPGKAATKPSKKVQASSNRAGARPASTETKSWFSKPSRPAKRDGQIKSISLSSPSLNNNNESKKSNKRPLTISGSSNVTVRRGQQTSKIEGQDDLSRSSSITNLNADRGKGAKPKKAESKDKLDKIEKKHDRNRTALAKNNNKEAEEAVSATDVEALQKQLAQMANEKSNLALQLGEQTGQLNSLQNEFLRLKMLQEESAQRLEQLGEENSILRNRLRDVAHSPLSDSEKQQLLYESHRHSSAPASIATNLLDDGGDITACPTPEWDKYSSSNVSEVSVACLQDKINQMQETHYSTNEELQATLQELTDLQRQLTELQQENLRLNDEKNLMFDSLCRQTERLNDSRNEVESLKQLLYKDESGQFETAAEREQKLVDLLKSAQEEREVLLMKQEQLGNDLEDSRSTNLIHNDEIAQLTERVKTLESTLDAKHAEHKLLDQELAQAKDQSSGRQIEINRLKDLLENARTKINELEQDRALSDKSELDELLDNARKEKDALESEVAHLKEQLALSKNESEKLREQVSVLLEECKVLRNNAKTTQSDLEYKLEKLSLEKTSLGEQLQQFQEAVNELQVQSQCHLDEKRQLSAVLSETQRNLNESESKIADLESELSELKKTKQEQEEEWEKFQNDLLTSVRVANDFKTEAQQDLQKLIMENKAGRERIKQLEAQIDKLKGGRRKSANKRLSTEESLMASLQRRYKEIEDLSEDQLNEEQRAIKVLKTCYEGSPKQKPIAKKPKDKLAISKPSLDSVISNPKLGRIVNDPKLRNVETFEYFSNDEEARNRLSLMSKVHSDGALPVHRDVEEMVRSKSLSDVHKEVVLLEEPTLRRYESTEHLPSLSRQKSKRSTVNLNTLEEICNNIDPNTPEDQLTKEQRFALRLREVLLKEEKKATLKKHPKLARKKMVISPPTQESVVKNEKLLHIIKDPVMRSVPVEPSRVTKRAKTKPVKRDKDRYSMPISMQQSSSKLADKSKSYSDISFSFNNTINMYSEPEEGKILDQVDEVLPPEEFRDTSSPPVREDAVLTTFQTDTNSDTIRKEHNYLEDDLDLEYIDEDADGQGDQEVDSVDTADFKDEDDFSDVLNETLLRRLDHEDDLLYHLDEEDIRARHDSRQRFSRVVEEIKGKFGSADDEDEKQVEEVTEETDFFTEVPLITIENTDWEAVEIVEDDQSEKKKTVETVFRKTHSIENVEKIMASHVSEAQRIEDGDATSDLEENTTNEDELKKVDEVTEKETVLKKEMELLKNEDRIVSIESNVEETMLSFKFEDADVVDSVKQVYGFTNKSEVKSEEFKVVDDMRAAFLKEEMDDFEQDWSDEGTVFSKKLPDDLSNLSYQNKQKQQPKSEDLDEEKFHIKEEMEFLTKSPHEDLLMMGISDDNKYEDVEQKEASNEEMLTKQDVDLLQKSPKSLADIDKEDLLMIKEQGKDLKQKLHLSDVTSEDSSEERVQDSTALTKEEIPKSRASDFSLKDLLLLDKLKHEDSRSEEEGNEEYLHEEQEMEEQELKAEDTKNVLEPLTKEEMRFLEKIPKGRASRPLSDINPEDLLLLDKLKERYLDEDEEVEGMKEASEDLEDPKDITEFLTKEEIDFLEKIPKGRASRPLSDINPEDLLLVAKLKEEYLHDDEEIADETENYLYEDEQESKNEDSQDVTDLLTKEEIKLLQRSTKDNTSQPSSNTKPPDEYLWDDEKEVQNINSKEKHPQESQEYKSYESKDMLTKEEMEFLQENTEELEDLLFAYKPEEEYLHRTKTDGSKNLLTKEEMEFLQKDTQDTEDYHLVYKPEEEHLHKDGKEVSTENLRKEYPREGQESKSYMSKDLLSKEEMDFLQKCTKDYLHSDETEVSNLELKEEAEKTDGSKELLTKEEAEFLQKIPTEDSLASNQQQPQNESEELKIEDSLSDIKPEDLLKTDKLKDETDSSIPPPDIKPDDSMVLEQFKAQYFKENEEKKEEERHKFPRILSPTKLTEPTSYEPVYANFQVTSPKSDHVPPPIFGKKPMALPRLNTFGTSTSDDPIYRDFGGQVRKTRFSITYDRKKYDTFKEKNQEKKTRVKDLRDVFERKSQSNFSSIVSKALQDEGN